MFVGGFLLLMVWYGINWIIIDRIVNYVLLLWIFVLCDGCVWDFWCWIWLFDVGIVRVGGVMFGFYYVGFVYVVCWCGVVDGI